MLPAGINDELPDPPGSVRNMTPIPPDPARRIPNIPPFPAISFRRSVPPAPQQGERAKQPQHAGGGFRNRNQSEVVASAAGGLLERQKLKRLEAFALLVPDCRKRFRCPTTHDR